MKKKQAVSFNIGDTYLVGDRMYSIKMIHNDIAFMAPIEDDIQNNKYTYCLDEKMDKYGMLSNGKKAKKYNMV